MPDPSWNNVFWRELKALHDEGWDYEKIAKIACRGVEYIRQYIGLVKNGEDRLIQGVEQEIFPISFAVLVAQPDDTTIQNVLMDALIKELLTATTLPVPEPSSARLDRRKRKGAGHQEYTVATLAQDIANATEAKDSFAREAQGKESRLCLLLDELEALCKDVEFVQLLQAEKLDVRPELTAKYNVGVTQSPQERSEP